jgi:hypothetical protein
VLDLVCRCETRTPLLAVAAGVKQAVIQLAGTARRRVRTAAGIGACSVQPAARVLQACVSQGWVESDCISAAARQE